MGRRIRIICSDPYATDCSADDEESIEVNNSTNANLIVRKFSNSIPANSHAQLQSGAGNFIGMVPDVSSPAAVDSPDPRAKKKYTGIRQRMSGRWTAEIRCPTAKKRLFLGTFSTAEEAADAYRKKRSEIDAMTSITKKQKEEKVAREKKIEPDELCERNYKGVRQRKSVRWTSEIRCPFTRGKKNEHDELCEKKYKGVRQRKSGRWTSEIRCPFTRRKSIHLGTFNTAEEAADAYNKKRCEFDMLISHKRKKVQANVDTKKVGVILKEPENTSNEEKCKVKVQTGKDSSSAFTFSNENSTTSVPSSQGSEGSNRSICKEIPDFFLPTEKEFGIGIINSHGELIGEYSRMDDDLWLCRPGDDDEYM